MTDTLTTAAVLLVPFLAVVLAGAVAVAIHDAIARAWAGRPKFVRAGAAAFAAHRPGASRGSARRGVPAAFARPGAAPRRPARRPPVVLVR
jgi:hypothetical protein